MEFFQKRMVCFGSDQMIDHVHGGGKEHFFAGLSGGIGNGFGQKGFAYPRIADKDAARVKNVVT